MDELPQGLESILSDPETMARLSRMAQQLLGGTPGDGPGKRETPEPGPTLPGDLRGLFKAIPSGRRPLAEALGPYLGEERRSRLTRALGMAAAMRLAGGALKGAGGHGV